MINPDLFIPGKLYRLNFKPRWSTSDFPDTLERKNILMFLEKVKRSGLYRFLNKEGEVIDFSNSWIVAWAGDMTFERTGK